MVLKPDTPLESSEFLKYTDDQAWLIQILISLVYGAVQALAIFFSVQSDETRVENHWF